MAQPNWIAKASWGCLILAVAVFIGFHVSPQTFNAVLARNGFIALLVFAVGTGIASVALKRSGSGAMSTVLSLLTLVWFLLSQA